MKWKRGQEQLLGTTGVETNSGAWTLVSAIASNTVKTFTDRQVFASVSFSNSILVPTTALIDPCEKGNGVN